MNQGANNLLMSESTTELPGFGGSLAVSFLFLGLVSLVGWGLSRFFRRRRSVGLGSIRVVSRVSIEARKSVLFVEAGGRGFLLGCCESGISLIAEMDPASFGIPALLVTAVSTTAKVAPEPSVLARTGEV